MIMFLVWGRAVGEGGGWSYNVPESEMFSKYSQRSHTQESRVWDYNILVLKSPCGKETLLI